MRKCDYHVDDVKKSVSFSKPAPPFTTSTMQQEASHKLNMTAERTSRVAQQLYEGVNIEGEGQHALITYIRTDSVRISPDFAKIALSFIAKNYGSEYAPKRKIFTRPATTRKTRTRQSVPSTSTALRNLSKARWTGTHIDFTNSCTSVLWLRK